MVVSDPTSPTAAAFMELGASVVREVAKMSSAQVRVCVCVAVCLCVSFSTLAFSSPGLNTVA